MIQFIIYQISKFRLLFYKYKIFKTHSFNIPIISVGNIESGGTGKTPMVDWLIKTLEAENKKICVITRGYGRQSNKTIVVDQNKKYALNEIGDEPFSLLKENPNLSMVIGSNKIKSIQLAIDKLDVDIIILDDGFQSLYIKRDLDIVMINVNNFSKKINREPISSLSRADIVIFKPDWPHTTTKPDMITNDTIEKDLEWASKIDWDNAWSWTEQNRMVNIIKKISKKSMPCIQAYASVVIHSEDHAAFEDITEPIIAVCGIADPISFQHTLAKKNINVVQCLEYSDHHIYTNDDMKNINQTMSHHNIKSIITTTKDYHKIKIINTHKIKIYIVNIKFDFQSDLEQGQDPISEFNKLDNESMLLEKINKAIFHVS